MGNASGCVICGREIGFIGDWEDVPIIDGFGCNAGCIGDSGTGSGGNAGAVGVNISKMSALLCGI